MHEPPLTESEARYLRDLRRLPTSTRSRVIGWTLELVPGIALFSYGLMTDSRTLMVLGFLSQLYFSLWRMYAQLRGFRLLRGIADKAMPSPEGPEGPDGPEGPEGPEGRSASAEDTAPPT